MIGWITAIINYQKSISEYNQKIISLLTFKQALSSSKLSKQFNTSTNTKLFTGI